MKERTRNLELLERLVVKERTRNQELACELAKVQSRNDAGERENAKLRSQLSRRDALDMERFAAQQRNAAILGPCAMAQNLQSARLNMQQKFKVEEFDPWGMLPGDAAAPATRQTQGPTGSL